MKKRYLRELQRITENAPRELIESLMKKEKLSPTMRTVLERAVKEPDDVVSPEKKQRFTDMLASGLLDKEVEVIDASVEKLLDEYFTAAIATAVRQGKLPKVAPKIKHHSLKNKGQQYARRNAARIREAAESDRLPPPMVESPQDAGHGAE